MGALHAGHTTLVTQIKRSCDRVVTSIFVNPAQFAAHEDLGRYPRDEAGDLEKLAAVGCDLVYAPSVAEIYPEGFATKVLVCGVADPLEGAHRPQFFGGVATVVCKLLTQCGPDAAIFGEKDYQQLQVIRRMVRDLDLPVSILAGPTVREEDGLALSSRNAYLTPVERRQAVALPQAMAQVQREISAGATIGDALAPALAALTAAGFGPIDYLAVCDPDSLEAYPVDQPLGRPARLLAAAWLGRTRLIDNIAVDPAIRA
jgi:pantoate--beta-alanine ligase